MKVLVTGGCGFIGSNIIKTLLYNDIEVVCLDVKDDKLNIVNDKFTYIKGSILDLDDCNNAFKNIDVICHQAALISVQESINNPIATHNVNVTGFLNILETARKHNIKKIVYASSAAVYGNLDSKMQTETMSTKQESPYGLSKHINELYAEMYSKLYGINCIGLRYFNVYGPGQEIGNAITRFIDLIVSNKRPTLYGNNYRDFVYIDDIVNANLLAIKNDNIMGAHVINIGSGTIISILETFNIIAKYLNSDIQPILENAKVGDIEYSCADITNATVLLGYRPNIEFKYGIKLMCDYFINK